MSDYVIHCYKDKRISFCGKSIILVGSWPIDMVTCEECLAQLATQGIFKTDDPRYHDTPIDEQSL